MRCDVRCRVTLRRAARGLLVPRCISGRRGGSARWDAGRRCGPAAPPDHAPSPPLPCLQSKEKVLAKMVREGLTERVRGRASGTPPAVPPRALGRRR